MEQMTLQGAHPMMNWGSQGEPENLETIVKYY